MINVTYKLIAAKKTASGTTVQLVGDDGFEWRLSDTPHPQQPAGCVTLWHWCSGSYRWLDSTALDAALSTPSIDAALIRRTRSGRYDLFLSTNGAVLCRHSQHNDYFEAWEAARAAGFSGQVERDI